MGRNGRKCGERTTALGIAVTRLMFSPTAHALDLRSRQHLDQLMEPPANANVVFWTVRQAILYLFLMEEQILGILQ